MSRLAELRSGAQSSSGAVLVLVALMLPVLVGAGGLVVDVGNWLSHKRHLQLQADAGALAGASRAQAQCIAKVPGGIERQAAAYSSVQVPAGAPVYNPQSGGTSAANLHRVMNSKTFYGQASPTDDTVANPDFCAAGMVDVKLTETNLPWFLRAAHVNYINAHARVEFRAKTIGGPGALPIGVPEVGPKKVKALFVNEATGVVIGQTSLEPVGSGGGLSLWSNAALPVSVTNTAADVGVRMVLSGTTSTTCGAPLVDCYGAGPSAGPIAAGTAGLVHIRGWSSAPVATATAPKARSVTLTGSGAGPECEDGYFTTIPAAYPCTVQVSANVSFGSTPPALATTRIFALRTGAKTSTGIALTAPATITGVWKGGSVPVNASEGAAGVDLRWGTGCTGPKETTCSASGSLGTVQRAFAGDEAVAVSGPIKLLRVTEGAVAANSVQTDCGACTTHSLVVTLGLKPTLQNAKDTSDPIVTLKVAATGGASRNQGLDCDDKVSNLRDELAGGCGPTYKVNDGSVACPGSATALWKTAQPWTCTAINTGVAGGQVTQGLNIRMLGAANPASCTKPNNWKSYPNLPEGDPRIVQVFLTKFGAFDGSGGGTVPVTGFATFYVTGWDSGGCQGAKAPAGKPDDPAGNGEVVGHYIKYIESIDKGGGSTDVCDFSALGSCVVVFTR